MTLGKNPATLRRLSRAFAVGVLVTLASLVTLFTLSMRDRGLFVREGWLGILVVLLMWATTGSAWVSAATMFRADSLAASTGAPFAVRRVSPGGSPDLGSDAWLTVRQRRIDVALRVFGAAMGVAAIAACGILAVAVFAIAASNGDVELATHLLLQSSDDGAVRVLIILSVGMMFAAIASVGFPAFGDRMTTNACVRALAALPGSVVAAPLVITAGLSSQLGVKGGGYPYRRRPSVYLAVDADAVQIWLLGSRGLTRCAVFSWADIAACDDVEVVVDMKTWAALRLTLELAAPEPVRVEIVPRVRGREVALAVRQRLMA